MDKRFKMLADDDSSAFSVSELIALYVGKPWDVLRLATAAGEPVPEPLSKA